MDEFAFQSLMIVLIAWAIILCLFMTIGVLAKKRGRSFGLWTMIPFLIPFVLNLLMLRIDGVNAYHLLAPFPIAYLVGLISVLLSGKTRDKRMEEIYEEERWRKQFRD